MEGAKSSTNAKTVKGVRRMLQVGKRQPHSENKQRAYFFSQGSDFKPGIHTWCLVIYE